MVATSAASAADRRSTGFTLIEVLISITILGVIMSVLALAMGAILRTVPTNAERVDEARYTRSLQSFLLRDLLSTPRDSIETDPVQGLCSPGDGTANLVQLVWDDNSTTHVADYRFAPNGDVERITCQGPLGALGAPTRRTLVHGVTSATAIYCTTSCQAGATLTLTFDRGPGTGPIQLTLTARNPVE